MNGTIFEPDILYLQFYVAHMDGQHTTHRASGRFGESLSKE